MYYNEKVSDLLVWYFLFVSIGILDDYQYNREYVKVTVRIIWFRGIYNFTPCLGIKLYIYLFKQIGYNYENISERNVMNKGNKWIH